MSLQESLKKTVSFKVFNASRDVKSLAWFAGHYRTEEVIGVGSGRNYDGTSVNGTDPLGNNEIKTPYLHYANPAALKGAGYVCDQVADDYENKRYDSEYIKNYPVRITPLASRTRVRDFLNYIKLTSARVSKIRITDFVNSAAQSNHELFNQSLEVSQSTVGTRGASDFIQLSSYIDPRNFQTNVIEIDLNESNLLLDETTILLMNVPGDASFQIDFILE